MRFLQRDGCVISQTDRIVIEDYRLCTHLANDLHFPVHFNFTSRWNGSDMQIRPKPSALRRPTPVSSRSKSARHSASSGTSFVANRKTEPVSMAISLDRKTSCRERV